MRDRRLSIFDKAAAGGETVVRRLLRVILIATVATLGSFWPFPSQADRYSDGHFSFYPNGESDHDIARAVARNLIIQGVAEDLKPIVGRWPSEPCFRNIDSDSATLRQQGDLLRALKQRLGVKIEACPTSSSPAITYFFIHGHVTEDQKREIAELDQSREDDPQLSIFLSERSSCYSHAHHENGGGLFQITTATVLVNLQLINADQMARCLFTGTAGALGLVEVVPAHDESVPIDWGPVVETDLLSLFILYHFKEEVIAGDSRDITAAIEAVVTAMHEIGGESSP
jgi:hypothetical protein